MPASSSTQVLPEGAFLTPRRRAFKLFETQRENAGVASKLVSGFIVGLIILNVLAVILESNKYLYAEFGLQFAAFELFSVSVFTIEYVVRLWIAPEYSGLNKLSGFRARLKYATKPMALIDLLAIAPFFLSLIVPIDLRYLRLFRLLRLLKLSHYFDGLNMFLTVLGREIGAIAGAILTLLVLIIISACLMFSIENAAQPGQFGSVSQAIWWSVVTLTTVGYGDITPVTFLGKFVAMIIMLLGVCTMALPAGILAAKFTEELQSRREYMNMKVDEAFRDGILDAGEQADLSDLQAKLNLPPEVFERLLASHLRARQLAKYCPHCGENLRQS